MTDGRATRGRSEPGFTLIEMMVVVIIVAVAMTAITLGFGATTQARLRSSAWIVASAARYAYARAVTQGTTARLVIDFENGTVGIQETRGRVVLSRDGETATGLGAGEEGEPDAGLGAAPSGGLESIGEGLSAMSDSFPDQTGTAAAADPLSMIMGFGAGAGADPLMDMMSGVSTGSLSDPFLSSLERGDPIGYRGPRFEALPGRRGEVRPLEPDSAFLRVFTPHEPTAREDGKAYVYFFPSGVTEHSVVQISDGADRVYSVEIHPLNGRAIVHPSEIEPEDDLDALMEADE